MVRRKGVVAALLIVCAACKPAPQKPAPAKGGVAQVRATVVTIRTTAGEKTTDHTLIIAGDKARSMNELDAWRLFDTKASTVTFVDDAARTIRTQPLDALLRDRRKVVAGALPGSFPRVTVKNGGTRAIAGVNARQTLIEVGGYRRELWLAEHNAIPRGLFAMMHASEAPTSPLAAMMRDADDALTGTRAFPFAERVELSGKVLIERSVVGIAQREVPAAVLVPPRGYTDLTPKPPAAARK